MINEKNFIRGAMIALAVGVVGIGYNQTRARADGIPAMQPMTYAGTLEEGNGAVNGTRNIRLTIWDDATSTESMRSRCVTTAQNTMVTNGRFQLTLDNACVAAVRSTPDLWLEIEVNGSSLGRTKLSSVPFAVEAARASGLTAAAANALVPTGTIVAFGGANERVPNGWLLCDGRSVQRSMYPALFDAIGTAHGGDGNNFNLPDLRGRFLRGVDGMAGRDPNAATRAAANTGGNSGNAVGTVQGGSVGAHTHPIDMQTSDQSMAMRGPGADYVGGFAGGGIFTGERWQLRTLGIRGITGPSEGGETRPVNVAVNFIIKI